MVAMVSARTDALRFDNAGLLWVKVCAFALMVLDHVDVFLLAGQGAHASLGRIVFPIFGVVLAYNMARTDPMKLLAVVVPRLLAIGVLTHPVYAYLLGAHVPLNIMFTLSVAVAVYALLALESPIAALLFFVVGGFVVDYAWIGILGPVLVALAFRVGGEDRALLAIFGFALALTAINGNAWALLSVPVVYLASRLSGDAPRAKHLFWLGYPLHLVVLAGFKLLA